MSDHDQLKTDFLKARLFWKPLNTAKMSTRRGSIQVDFLNGPSLLCFLSACTAQIEDCYYTDWRVWVDRLPVSHMKHHVKFTSEQVLTTIVEVLECGEHSTEWHSQSMTCFCLTVFVDFDRYNFSVCEAHFRTESIGASPVIILHAIPESYLHFFTRLLNVNVL